MLRWILEHIGVVIFVVIFITQIARGIARSRKASAEHESTHSETDEQRRVREVQERIRRQIAERTGSRPARVEPPPLARPAEAPPAPRPQTTQMPELFGGPLGRMLEELQKRSQQPPPPQPPPPVVTVTSAHTAAEVGRQEQLAEQLRVIEEQRVLVQRRAAHLAADQRELAASESALRGVARARLDVDLADTHALRRAFVLREVLGPPVSLR